MRRNRIYARAIGAAAVLGLWGCDDGSDSGDTGADSVEREVDRAGGEVELGLVTLAIPAGALEALVAIRITQTSERAPGEYAAATPVFRFEPEGLRFARPVTVRFAGSFDARAAVWWSATGQPFEALPTRSFEVDRGSADVTSNSRSSAGVEASVDHFSAGFVGQERSTTHDAPDGGAADGSFEDGSFEDGGADFDSGSAMDSGMADAGSMDSGALDSGMIDSGTEDAGGTGSDGGMMTCHTPHFPGTACPGDTNGPVVGMRYCTTTADCPPDWICWSLVQPSTTAFPGRLSICRAPCESRHSVCPAPFDACDQDQQDGYCEYHLSYYGPDCCAGGSFQDADSDGVIDEDWDRAVVCPNIRGDILCAPDQVCRYGTCEP